MKRVVRRSRMVGVASVVAVATFAALQFMLMPSARSQAVAEFRHSVNGGLGVECNPIESELRWSGLNSYEVRVGQFCGPRKGEWITYRLTFGLGGWYAKEIDHAIACFSSNPRPRV